MWLKYDFHNRIQHKPTIQPDSQVLLEKPPLSEMNSCEDEFTLAFLYKIFAPRSFCPFFVVGTDSYKNDIVENEIYVTVSSDEASYWSAGPMLQSIDKHLWSLCKQKNHAPWWASQGVDARAVTLIIVRKTHKGKVCGEKSKRMADSTIRHIVDKKKRFCFVVRKRWKWRCIAVSASRPKAFHHRLLTPAWTSGTKFYTNEDFVILPMISLSSAGPFLFYWAVSRTCRAGRQIDFQINRPWEGLH